ncbi:2-oxo acid dehydrogenase subunit E2, partial [Robiginitalea sp.]|nr:2-oxo acid dehydrogenase subunit E2 [Robiginitalea sp.]
MSRFELKLPQMGESVAEATLTSWLKEVGDPVEADEAVFEIATDKVDSEVPSEVEGILIEKRFGEDDVIRVGEVVAVIEIAGTSSESVPATESSAKTATLAISEADAVSEVTKRVEVAHESVTGVPATHADRFYSPLVRNM